MEPCEVDVARHVHVVPLMLGELRHYETGEVGHNMTECAFEVTKVVHFQRLQLEHTGKVLVLDAIFNERQRCERVLVLLQNVCNCLSLKSIADARGDYCE